MSTLGVGWLVITVAGLATVLSVLFRWIFSLDVDVARRQGVDYIAPRALIRWIAPAFMIVGAGIVVAGANKFSWDDPNGVGAILFGSVFCLITGFASNTHLWLDEEGVHYRSGVGRVQTIVWKSLDHYEVRRVSDGESTTVYYDFVSQDGVKISLSKSTYDIDELLSKMRLHVDLPERPYQRRSWFG